MPTLAQLLNGSSDPTLISLATSNPVIEPLDGPTSVDTVFDRFPEEVYQQGKDSHLYRLLSALGGDSGAGFVKAQVYAARLQFEAEFLNTAALDSFYGYQFNFPRLKSETYAGIDPDNEAQTPPTWDQIALADQSYRQRIAEFWTATRGGTTPEGLIAAAQSAIGVECDLVENYKWVFDQYSDDPLGLEPYGTTASISEFIIIPRFEDLANATDYGYTVNYPIAYVFTSASGLTGRPALGGTPPSVAIEVSDIPDTALVPDLEHNLIDILDHLRPMGSLASVSSDQSRYTEITSLQAHASSERIHVSRLVTGASQVAWPPVDPTQGYFIESGVEKEATHYNNSARELPIIFLTIEATHSYTEQALNDPAYTNNAFFVGSPSPEDVYRSEHTGFFSPIIQGLYPFLNGISNSASFDSDSAIAVHTTPLSLETKL